MAGDCGYVDPDKVEDILGVSPEEARPLSKRLKQSVYVTPQQIVRLAAAISADNMASIAEGYMDIDDTTIKNLQYENRGKAEAFNREMIRHWANRNPDNQVQVR